jgi:large subunit ribosomal protein L25
MKAGGTQLIDMTVDSKTITVLAREVQRDVLRGSILHADFFAVDESATISTEVQVHIYGDSPAVASGMGMLLTGTNTITIETLPSHLIDAIRVDISVLENIGDGIYVRDLDLGPDIAILNDADDMIVRVIQSSAARADEETEAEEGGAAEPEVIHRGKAEEDED